ncbi:MAG TPA: hypothetical protein VKE98_16150 [Gemmataceae bacterium]|nr:hypothetical protein [Gemmataceae bacterium]
MPKQTSVAGVLITLLSLAAAANAQPQVASFAELQGRVKIGDAVNVTDDAGKTIKGNVEQVSDTMLVLRSAGHDLPMPVLKVQRISRPVHTLRNGALIGLAGGFTIGAIAAASSSCQIVCFASPGGVLLIGGLVGSIGMGTGAAVGASMHRERVIFERTTTGRREVAVVPLVSRAGAGLRVEVGF